MGSKHARCRGRVRGMARAVREVDEPDLPLDVEEVGAVELASSTHWEAARLGPGVTAPDKSYDVMVKECVLDGVDLSGKRLVGLTATDVRFEGCDLAGAVLD